MADDNKYRFPSMVVAIIDLAMTILSIYLVVMVFFLAFALSSCLFNPKDDCSTQELNGGGGGGLGKFGINLNFEQSYNSYSHSVTSGRSRSGDSRAGGDESLDENESEENEIDIDNHNEVIDFGKSFPGFGFDNKNRDSSKNKQVDLDFGIDNMDFGKATGSRRNSEQFSDRNSNPLPNDKVDFSYGRKGNQNQKPSGFEWFIQPYSENSQMGQRNPDPRSRADFQQFNPEGKESEKKVEGFTRMLFIIIVVVLWIFFVIAVIVEVVMIIAAIRLLMATKEGKQPRDALRSANCWRICTVVLIVLIVLNFFGGSGRSNLESVVVGGANVLFRVIGVIIVSLFIRELEEASQSQQGQDYYDVGESGGGGGGGQMIHMNGNYNNQQQSAQGQDGIGWNMPKQV